MKQIFNSAQRWTAPLFLASIALAGCRTNLPAANETLSQTAAPTLQPTSSDDDNDKDDSIACNVEIHAVQLGDSSRRSKGARLQSGDFAEPHKGTTAAVAAD